jgi:Putative Ig domain
MNKNLHLIVLASLFLGVPQLHAVSTLGSKVTFAQSDSEGAPTKPAERAFSVASGASLVFGPGAIADKLGRPYHRQWVCEVGTLHALTPELNHIQYTAPVVGTIQKDVIYVWLATASGKAMEAVLEITVVPSGTSTPPTTVAPSQVSAQQSGTGGDYVVNYAVGTTVTRAWIEWSANGATWSSLFDVLFSSGVSRQSSRTVTVGGATTRSRTYFRIKTQEGTTTPVVGAAFEAPYSPPVSTPKASELPGTTNVIINGDIATRSDLPVFWRRINDSSYRDNAVSYQVETAYNPDFTGSSILEAPNNAAGTNLYENVFYTLQGLQDNQRLFARVRGVNFVGAGPWGETDWIDVRIQDWPVIANQPSFPAHGATGISRTPKLEIQVQDPDNDPLRFEFLIREIGKPSESGQVIFTDVPVVKLEDWKVPLRPNVQHEWRVTAWEQGRTLDYYNGVRPTSSWFPFTTVNDGGAYLLSNPRLVSGAIRPDEFATFRLTVSNNGVGKAEANIIDCYSVIGGVEHLMAWRNWGSVPELLPGTSAEVDVPVRFQSGLLTINGEVRDNRLVAGNNLLRFKSNHWSRDTPQVSLDHAVTYTNQGAPVISGLYIPKISGSGKPVPVALGSALRVWFGVQDDVRTTRLKFEVRTAASPTWQLLDDYTGGQTQNVNLPGMSHSGATVPNSQSGFEWTIPPSFGETSTLELRMSAYDDAGLMNTASTEYIPVFDGTFVLNAGATGATSYRLGDVVRFPIQLAKVPERTVGTVNVRLDKPDGNTSLLKVQMDPDGPKMRVGDYGPMVPLTDPEWFGPDGTLVLPPVLSVTLPTNRWFASSRCSIHIEVTGTVNGQYGTRATDITDGTFTITFPELPAPFNMAQSYVSPDPVSWPAGAWATNQSIDPVAVDMGTDGGVHCLVRNVCSYWLPEMVNGNLVSNHQSKIDTYYCRVDRVSRARFQVRLPPTSSYEDIKVWANVPYVLMRDGTALSVASVSFSGLGARTYCSGLVAEPPHTSMPELVRVGSGLSVASTSSAPGLVGVSRLQQVVPGVWPLILQPSNLGRHVDYGFVLTTPQGAYRFGSGGMTVTNQIVGWPSSTPIWFGSSDMVWMSARSLVEGGRSVVDLYDGDFAPHRWNLDLQDVRIHMFRDVGLAIGQAAYASGRGEDHEMVVVRRNMESGLEERLHFGDGSSGNNARRSVITHDRWVALLSKEWISIGYFGGDIIAPTVTLQNPPTGFTSGQPVTMTWAASDNLGQIASVKVMKQVNGVSTELASLGASATNFTTTLSDNASSVTLRVEAYDLNGNRGVAEAVLVRNSSFGFTSATADSYSVAMGAKAIVRWSASPEDPLRPYQVWTRPQGSVEWTPREPVVGSSYALGTSLMSGAMEVKVVSGNQERTLPQVIQVTGNRFAFRPGSYLPATGASVVFPNGAAFATLQWDSNQPVSPNVRYTVLGRWSTSTGYTVLGETSEKSLSVAVTGRTYLEWQVVAVSDGVEFSSGSRTVSLSQVAATPSPVLAVGDRTVAGPWVDVSWPAVAGAEAVVIYRQTGGAGALTEIGRADSGAAGRFRDTSAAYGIEYRYRLATMLRGEASELGPVASITLQPLLPVGVNFITANQQLVSGNSHFVQWTAQRPEGVTAVYESYLVLLRRANNTIVKDLVVEPAIGQPASASFSGLGYNEGYVVEVYPQDHSGQRISEQSTRLFFTTGFDTRPVAPAVMLAPVATMFGFNVSWEAVLTADLYDVFRSTNGGVAVFLGQVTGTTYMDSSVQVGQRVLYMVRARNDNTFADSQYSPEAIFYDEATVVTPSWQMTTTDVGEADGLLSLMVTLDRAPTTAFTLPLSLAGTGNRFADYQLNPILEWSAGEQTKVLLVTITQDAALEGAETVELTFGQPSGNVRLPATISSRSMTLRIADDEAAVSITNSGMESRIAALGGQTRLWVEAAGYPGPTYRWRNPAGTVIAGEVGPSLTLNALAVTQAGVYTVDVANAHGSISRTAAVGVADLAQKTYALAGGGTASFAVTASSNVVGAQWLRGTQPLTNLVGRISGATTRAMTLSKIVDGDTGDYTCQLTLAGGVAPITTGAHALRVVAFVPDITTAALPDGIVSGLYQCQIECVADANRAVSSFSAAGLPPGLAINVTTGLISGRPNVALTAAKTYSVTLKATNSKGTDTQVLPLLVYPLDARHIGTFVGFLYPSPINGDLGGRMDLTTTNTGAFTGKLTNGVDAHAVSGRLDIEPWADEAGFSVVIPRTGRATLNLRGAASAVVPWLTKLEVASGDELASGFGWKGVRPPSNMTGYHTFGMEVDVSDGLPQGGFGAFTVAATGAVSLTTKLGDGVVFTTAAPISSDGNVLLHTASATQDSVVGSLTLYPGTDARFTQDSLIGSLTWVRKPQPNTSFTYRAGFTTMLSAFGGRYRAPPAIEAPMGLLYAAGTTSNAVARFSGGDWGAGLAPEARLLFKPNSVSSVLPGLDRTRTVTFAVVASTGAFSGGLSVVDPSPVNGVSVTRRGVSQGTLVTRDGVLQGYGFGLLSDLPQLPAGVLGQTPIKSIKVEVSPE